ncbi:hypothetical protein Q8A67_024169 [Cirrhinus molitorella]|uniref:Uncharacterized protein n=1 Tax=Cirrhinus molitorella TaxID=172907 RepID=A0AA88TA78_9TELE|nr:hypothetical protein Q8A67_024169 [Cirrhinus molitorella]
MNVSEDEKVMDEETGTLVMERWAARWDRGTAVTSSVQGHLDSGGDRSLGVMGLSLARLRQIGSFREPEEKRREAGVQGISQVGVLERLNHTLTPSPPVYPQLSCNATLTMIRIQQDRTASACVQH